MNLARALVNLKGDESLGFAIGVVTDTSPFTVQINGDTVDIVSPPRCSSYTPAVDDVVLVLRPGPAFLVVDQIV
jgi:hypothetical protein